MRFSPSDFPPRDFAWQVVVKTPFTIAMSKNQYWRTTKRGHTYIPDDSRAAHVHVVSTLHAALPKDLLPLERRKLWLSMLVEKPDNRSDAINFTSTYADAAKIALQLDDRWYSLGTVDWLIVPEEPQIWLQVGQLREG